MFDKKNTHLFSAFCTPYTFRICARTHSAGDEDFFHAWQIKIDLDCLKHFLKYKKSYNALTYKCFMMLRITR